MARVACASVLVASLSDAGRRKTVVGGQQQNSETCDMTNAIKTEQTIVLRTRRWIRLLAGILAVSTLGLPRMAISAEVARGLNIAALAYGRSPTYSNSECAEIGKRFDVVIGSPGELCAGAIKDANGDVILLSYINTSNFTDGDSLYRYAKRHGGVDLFALNAITKAVQVIDEKKIELGPGDRVWSYRQGNRWQTDYTSKAGRERLLQYVRYEAENLKRSGWSGFFIDNEDRGCGYSGHLQEGDVEGDFKGPVDLESGMQMEANCNALKLLLEEKLPLDVYLVHNTGNYGTRSLARNGVPRWFWQERANSVGSRPLSREFARAFVVARGVLQEFRYSFQDTLADIDDNYGGLHEIWEKKGKPANHVYIMWWLRRGAAGIAENSDRVKLFAMGTHLLYQWSGAYIRFDGADRNNEPLKGDWFGAMGSPLGMSAGDKRALDGRTYRRDFGNGVVIVRFRTSGGEDYSDAGTYRLGGEYFSVAADGSLGANAVTEVKLRNSEAFVGIRKVSGPIYRH